MIEAEQYDEYGEIVKAIPDAFRLSEDQKHRIHQTKDLFDGNCSYCQAYAEQRQKNYYSWWYDNTDD